MHDVSPPARCHRRVVAATRGVSTHTQTSLDDVAPAIKPETRGYNPESFHVAVNHTLLLYCILRLKLDLVC